MAFAHSVTALYRTSRALNARGANPVNRVFGHDRFGARGYAAAFQRDKPHVNIGMPEVISEKYCVPNSDRMQAQLATSIMERLHSQRRSRNGKQKRATQSTLTMAPSIKRPKKEREVSRYLLLMSSTTPTTATIPTSIALATPITSRT
jgi:hypothetical protein